MDVGLSDLKNVFFPFFFLFFFIVCVCVNLPQYALLKQKKKTSLWNLRLGNVHDCENGGKLEFVIYLDIIKKYFRGTELWS